MEVENFPSVLHLGGCVQMGNTLLFLTPAGSDSYRARSRRKRRAHRRPHAAHFHPLTMARRRHPWFVQARCTRAPGTTHSP